MFKKLKQKLIRKKKLRSYLTYALGEIILIVIGILIAVSINNWNQQRQTTQIKNGIFEVVLNDLSSDSAEAATILEYYKERKPIFDKVINEALTEQELEECIACRYLITSRRLFSINQRGYQQLNDFQNISDQAMDTLSNKVISFYSLSTFEVAKLNDFIDSDVTNNLQYWRDKYAWYKDYIYNNTLNKESVAYFGRSSDYKNRVAYHYTIIYENYVPMLRLFISNATSLSSQIRLRLNGNRSE